MGIDPIDADDEDVERLARARRLARGLGVAARRAIRLARRYRDEEGPRGERERACVAQALVWRAAARELRSPAAACGPGVARASAARAGDARRAV